MMTKPTDNPRENLVRARRADDAATIGDESPDQESSDGRTLHGHFSVFDSWYEINSTFEGNFLERVSPGAFEDTLRDDVSNIKVLYDHGFDPSLGNKPLGPILRAEEDEVGAAYEVRLIDTDYNRDFIIPAAAAGLLGSSFRFSVREDDWVHPKDGTDDNPGALSERTITRMDVHEFGPVTFPANGEATAGVRSTDDLYERLLSDPLFAARFAERTSARRLSTTLETIAEMSGSADTSTEILLEVGSATRRSASHRRRMALAATR